MNKLSNGLPARQSGFTLIELVIVMVIIGILGAVAIISLGNSASQARIAKQQATLGALKGAWGVAYATAKAGPTCAQVAAQMVDPACAAAPAITCTGVTGADGTGSASFTCTDAGIATSAAITCDASAGC